MDGLSLTSYSFFNCIDSCPPRTGRARNMFLLRRPSKFMVFASNEEPQLDRWDQMELRFGRMLGEDPKLTLAKIMGRKVNPDASFIEIEKSFQKNKGNLEEIEELPFDVSKKGQSSSKHPQKGQSSSSLGGLNLVRPVPKKGIKFESDDKSITSEIKKPSQSVRKPTVVRKGTVPNVILRKPTVFNEDDVEDKPSRLRIKPNLSLKMRDGPVKENFSNMTLLKKPEPLSENNDIDEKENPSGDEDDNLEDIELVIREGVPNERVNDFTLLKKPESNDKTRLEENLMEFRMSKADVTGVHEENDSSKSLHSLEEIVDRTSKELEESEYGSSSKASDDSDTRLQPQKLSANEVSENRVNLSTKATLQGKPKRLELDQSLKETSNSSTEEAVVSPDSYDSAGYFVNVTATSALEEHENADADWTRAEDLAKTGDRADVELISSSTRGFVVSFGSLIGFLPYRNLAAKWKFLAFESWLRRKGLDPSKYKQHLGIIGSYDSGNSNIPFTSDPDPKINIKIEGELSPDMKLEDLLMIYDQEKMKFLSSFIGQKIKVNVALANRKSRKLIFSIKPKEKEELVEKKRSLMAKLQVGDVVKCCIKKITYFGIFVEVEGVPALIHQTEISWDANIDPASFFKIGQVVEAKVQQLDFTLERIFLSLKQIMPDPLTETLDSVIGDRDPLDERLQAAELDTEWDDLESLIKELQEIEGIEAVSKGRFFLSPGLAPTFQVYMASMYENQYKLLARAGNKVQEVIVQTSMDKEKMKSAILACTCKVE